MGATLGGMLCPGAALSIDHVRHGGLYGFVAIVVGLPHMSWGRIRMNKSMEASKGAENVSYRVQVQIGSARNSVEQVAGDWGIVWQQTHMLPPKKPYFNVLI
jgi:hypothetical protein